MAFSQVALLVARKQSSYIFNYQQQEYHCMILKSNVWDTVNKIFLELAKTKCSSSFGSSSEMWEYSFLLSFKLPFIHEIPIDLILFPSPSICSLRLSFQRKIARLSSSNLKTHEVIIISCDHTFNISRNVGAMRGRDNELVSQYNLVFITLNEKR